MTLLAEMIGVGVIAGLFVLGVGWLIEHVRVRMKAWGNDEHST